MPELTNNRSGAQELLKRAKALCAIVQVNGPLIRTTFPSNTLLLGVLTVAENICPLLPAADAEMVAFMADSVVFDPADDATIPGTINI